MMKRSLFLSCFFMFCAIVNAGVIVYNGSYDTMDTVRSQWLSDIGIAAPDTTIDFESGFTQDESILGVTLAGGLTVSSTSGGYADVTADSSDTGRSLSIGTYGVAIHEHDNYTFDFSSDISYFAFYMYDQTATGMDVNYADGTSEQVIIPTSGSSGLNGRFLGLVSDKDITSLYIADVRGGDWEVGIDNIEFGYLSEPAGLPPVIVVPEPATIVILGLGSLMLRRKRK